MLACLHFCSAALLVRFPFLLRDGAGVLSRVAFMDGNGCVMLGTVISCEKKDGFEHHGFGDRHRDFLPFRHFQLLHGFAAITNAVMLLNIDFCGTA